MGERTKQLEATLAEALQQAAAERSRSEAIVAAIGDGVSIQDREFRVLYQNQVHRDMVGGDFAGQFCYRAFGARESVCPECPVARCFADGGIHKLVKTLRPERGPGHIEIIASPLRDPDGTVVAGIEVVRDISAHMAARQEILQLNRDLEERAGELAAINRELEAFSSSLSHDLRVPLTRIFLAGQLLQERAGSVLDSEGRELLATMLEAGEFMEELIEAMLVLARASRGEIARERLTLDRMAEDILMGLRLQDPAREVSLEIEPGLVALGDRHLIQIALQNLLGNAWKYSRESRPVRICFFARRGEGGTVFAIADNGPGFPPEQAGRLFVPFQRLHPELDIPGHGIGLTTVQRIVQRHGGRIWADAEPGRGATFHFTLGGS